MPGLIPGMPGIPTYTGYDPGFAPYTPTTSMASWPIVRGGPRAPDVGPRAPGKTTKRRTTQGFTLQSLMGRLMGMIETPAQQQSRAKSLISDQINMEIAANQESSRRAQQQLEYQQARASSFAQAVAQMTAGAPAEAQKGFEEAANRLKGYGTGLTGAVADAQTAAANQLGANVAENTGGLISKVGGYDIPGLRSTGQYTGVVIPGTNLEEMGANARLMTALSDRTQAMGIQGIAREYGGQIAQSIAEELQSEKDIQAKRPALIRQQLSELQSGGRQDIATALQAMALMGTQGSRAFDQSLKTRQQILAEQKQAAAEKLANQKLTYQQKLDKQKAIMDAQRIAISSGHLTGVYNGQIMPGFHYDPKTKTIVKTSTAAGGTSPKDVRMAITGLRSTLKDAVRQPPFVQVTQAAIPGYGVQADYSPLMRYAAAKQALLDYFDPSIQGSPAVQRVVEDYLAQVKYVKPGTKPKTPKKPTKPKKGRGKGAAGSTSPYTA